MNKKEIEEYRPVLIKTETGELYTKVLIPIHRCPICAKSMVEHFRDHTRSGVYHQMVRAGFVWRSNTADEHYSYICIECEKAGCLPVICALCGEQRLISQIKESHGDPAEHLCKACYETAPAKQWLDKQQELREEHRWDFS